MAEANKKPNVFVRAGQRIKRWFREMRSELKKVVWPTKSQMVNNVIIVLICCLIVGIFIWVFDAIASLFVQGLITLFKG
jgi:preprotein translocase subunit SecE